MSSKDTPHPAVSEGLLKHLERCYPDRCPDPLATERGIWMSAGAAALIRKLRQEFDRQSHVENEIIP